MFRLGAVILSVGVLVGAAELDDSPCECNLLGTSTDKHGVLQRDDRGACVCLKNVIGKDCEKCRQGYFGIMHGRGCEACDCHPEGSQSVNCHQLTGQCLCKTGFTGWRCDTCDYKLGDARILKDDACGTPCDRYRAEDPLFRHENGTCKYCASNQYLNLTSLECTKCPRCYDVLGEKLQVLEQNLQKISLLSNASTNQNHPDFVRELAALQNKIFGLSNKLLKKPMIRNVVKLNHLATILDLTERSSKDINTYLNGQINFKFLEKLLHELRELFEEAGRMLEELHGRHNNELSELVKDAENEVEHLNDEVDFYETEGFHLQQEADRFLESVKNDLAQFKEKPKVESEKVKFRELKDANTLLNRAKQYKKDAESNKSTSEKTLDQASKLKLPKWVQHELPTLNGTFDDLTERIEAMKKNYDDVNVFLRYLNATESNAVVKGDLPPKLQNKREDLLSKAEDILNKLLKDLKDFEERKEEHGDIIEVEDSIKQLNSDIDSRQKQLNDLMKEIQKAKEDIQKTKDETLKEYETVLEKLLKKLEKYKKQHLEIQEDIKEMHELIETIKEIRKMQEEIKELQRKIQIMRELIDYLQIIPVEDFENIEQLLNSYEEYFKFINKFKKVKDSLEKEVNQVKTYLESLPDDTFLECQNSLT